ncbi:MULTISPECIES: sn-glycerol-3-phosphate ABC transporter ATP-binding protein UgpC [unclassified Epibacterium]|uniref:sn-glycerol-3-phosphate ABC transporter ATP-binding protein UgpC n=1 Tax=unclassified Epibacterium TaxID=2639179 RepID=UPI001EF4D9BD|nr:MULTISPECIES: sn-glycerol-3-phosphate ABC transporter ATP-binding protein UgpC [unclassified Epibacterium]MCG7622654.1 sn-glycerol-3-phosphate ABC transporter ATP-binding protein UgpC [Epibacterium sp. Ofav1-8]MCG7626566.1 sn-glycerol-3-phosphate ABC transporter ATP-binding protein UgpC [Epibacterium sp. MM17-32]
MAQVTLDRVRKTYPNGFEAVQPCSVEIPDGELVVLVGPSGCGKSTLLRMIAGLEDITDGALSIGTDVVNDKDPADRNIAMVFQNYALYPHMSVAKNMGYGLKNRGASKAEIDAKVQEAARILNLGDYLDRRPSQLSGGQRQRVAMGRAIVRDPELFLFDEPLSNLDAKLRNQMRIEIRALQQRLGVTSVYVTHDQVEAMTMADRIIVLNAGRVEQIGTPTEIYERPASTFVAGFMGAPPMNLMTAALVSGQLQVGGETKLPLTPPAVATDEVLVGYRPEDVRLGGDGSVVLDVQIIEELGANRLLHGQLGGQAFSISIGKDEQAQVGPQPITLPQDRVHFFHPERGTRL